jgi:hypothetical protein
MTMPSVIKVSMIAAILGRLPSSFASQLKAG